MSGGNNKLDRVDDLLDAAVGMGLDMVTADDLARRRATRPAEEVEPETAPAITFKSMSCAELDAAEFEHDFIIEDTLEANQPALAGAAPKMLKTIISIDAGVSIATATPFLGQFAVHQARTVGYMCGEGGPSTLQDYARRVARGRGLELGDIGNLWWCTSIPLFESLDHLDALRRFILDHAVEVLFLDPIYLGMPAEEAGNLLRQGKVLRAVNDVCLRLSCTPVLIHHTKRSVVDPYQPAELTDLAWSGFSEFAAQWWLLSRREKYDADQPGEHKLWFNVGGRAGHAHLWALDVHEGRLDDIGGRRWQVEVLRPSEVRREVEDRRQEAREAKEQDRLRRQIDADKQRITRAAAKYPAGETATTIRDTAGLNGQRFALPFADLIQSGEIIPVEITKRNRRSPYEGYKLAE